MGTLLSLPSNATIDPAWNVSKESTPAFSVGMVPSEAMSGSSHVEHACHFSWGSTSFPALESFRCAPNARKFVQISLFYCKDKLDKTKNGPFVRMCTLETLALAVEQPGFRPTLQFYCFTYTRQTKKATHWL